MKKTLATILVLSLIVALSACGELATVPQKQNENNPAVVQPTEKLPETPVKQEESITKEQAVELALQDAGVSKDAAIKVEAELEEDQTEVVWDVEIETAEKEYSYHISADDGKVEKVEVEQENPRPVETTPETVPPTEPVTQPVQTQPATEKQVISRDQAIEIALNAAGLKKSEVTDLEAELDKERSGLYWEVSFETRKMEYDYDIHAYDGTVVKAETEKEEDRPEPQPTQKPTEPETQPATKQVISREQAVEIALNAAGLKKSEVSDLEAELDKERSGLYWEVSFETKQKEYDYDIHAETGKVTKVETEKEKEKPVVTEPAKAAVTKDQAIEIALEKAGLSREAVFELEAELEKEKNGLFWEISFETRETEYSYEINAENGKIVKSESERND